MTSFSFFTQPQAKNSTEYVFETDDLETRTLWLDNLKQVLAVEAINQEMSIEDSLRLVRAERQGLLGWMCVCVYIAQCCGRKRFQLVLVENRINPRHACAGLQ